MMMTSCVEVIEGVKMGYYQTMGIPNDAAVCSDPEALSVLGPPAGWFLNRCCMACGYELGYEFPDSWKWY